MREKNLEKNVVGLWNCIAMWALLDQVFFDFPWEGNSFCYTGEPVLACQIHSLAGSVAAALSFWERMCLFSVNISCRDSARDNHMMTSPEAANPMTRPGKNSMVYQPLRLYMIWLESFFSPLWECSSSNWLSLSRARWPVQLQLWSNRSLEGLVSAWQQATAAVKISAITIKTRSTRNV